MQEEGRRQAGRGQGYPQQCTSKPGPQGMDMANRRVPIRGANGSTCPWDGATSRNDPDREGLASKIYVLHSGLNKNIVLKHRAALVPPERWAMRRVRPSQQNMLCSTCRPF